MKTRGLGMKVVKLAGVTVFASSVLVLVGFHKFGKQDHQAQPGVRRSPAAASPDSKLSRAKEDSRWAETYGKLPLSFEENQGQTAQQVRYVTHGDGYELFLTPQEAVLALAAPASHDFSPHHRFETLRAIREASGARTMAAVRMRFEGANPAPRISATNQLVKSTNYFIGNDPKKWHTNVPSYARVQYADIYPGIDLAFYGNQRQLEYDFIVAPGADPKAIRLSLRGARKLRINMQGDVVLSVADGELKLQRPVVYQMLKGERHEIAGRYVVTKGHQLTFSVPTYDRSEPLVLDPVLNYATYLGGSASDAGQGIAVDSQGDAFVVGLTTSADFPGASGSISAANANGAVFVTEIDPTGTKQLYSSYLAGTGTGGDFGLGIALDPSGNIYVTGATFSSDFPTTSANALKSGTNAGAVNGTSFVTKINPNGGASQLVYSSYLGGTGLTTTDFGNSVAADANGNAYVTGFTAASPGSGLANFPVTTANAFQATLGGPSGNAFLARIDTNQSKNASLIYSTYLGGNGANAASSGKGYGEQGLGVAVDTANNAYLAGTTTSTDFPTTTSGFQTKASPPAAVAKGTVFTSRIDTTKIGNASLIYSTYLGGDTEDFGTAIALGPNNVAYVTGSTHSAAFPKIPAGAYQSGSAAGSAFISLIDTGLIGSTSLKYSTGLGQTNTLGFGIRADAAGNAYVVGGTGSTGFPVTPGAFQLAFAAGASGEGFLSKLSPGGNGTADLDYSTFFGGSGSASSPDSINAIALDASNPPNAFVTGQTFSTANFPVFPPATATTPAFQTTLKGTSDAFIAKLTLIPTLVVSPTSLDFGTVLIPNTSAAKMVTLTNNTNAAITFTSAIAYNGNPPANPPVPSTEYAATNTCGGSIPFGATNTCTVSVTFNPSVAGPRPATLVLTDGDSTSPQNIALSGIGAIPTPAVTLAPTSLTFGNQALNTTSPAQTVTLTNTGTGSLTITAIGTSGDFAQTNTCGTLPAMLAASANCTISVTFTPTAAGTRMGTLTITDNAAGSPHTVSLTGTTTPPDFGLAGPTSVQNVTAGSTLNFNVTMTPVGGFTGTVALACTGAPSRSTCTVTPASVAAANGTTAQTAQVSLATTALMAPPTRIPTPPISIRQVVPVLLAMLLMFLLARTQQMRVRLGMVTAMVLLLVLAGCGGGYNGTTKGPTTLTITGTSGTLTPKTALVQISVN